MVHLPHSPGQTTADFESYQDRRQFLGTVAMGQAAGAASLLSARPRRRRKVLTRPFHIDIPGRASTCARR